MAGSGKSTQGKLLAERIGCIWESSGDLHRKKLTGPAREDMLSGKLIRDEVTLAFLAEEFEKMHVDGTEFVFDGFPRSLKQAEWLVDNVRNGKIKMTGIIHLVAHKEIALERLMHRSRKDDTEPAIARRLSDYEQTILPILDYLRSEGMPVFDIEADDSIKEVELKIDEALGV
ncbi:MAG: adenylate kinase [Candidatus Saccharibacteria bacterium]|nr:adenylate kinase [Candidatus Saccharibacteria bacterium]